MTITTEELQRLVEGEQPDIVNGMDAAECISYLARRVLATDKMAEALSGSMETIDDWLNIYAEDFCNEDRVKEAKSRVYEHGTLAYIAMRQEKNRAAFSAYEATK